MEFKHNVKDCIDTVRFAYQKFDKQTEHLPEYQPGTSSSHATNPFNEES